MVKSLRRKKGFGIVEVLVSAAVLGFMYLALLNLQGGNREALLRIRGRDGAVDVAQQVLDSLKSVGIASIPTSASDRDTTFTIPWDINRSWGRGAGDSTTVAYTAKVTVLKTSDFTANNESQYETVQHIYAKQVNVEISWMFKGSRQSINVSGVIR